MKGVALLLLCAVALAQADRPQLSRSGQVCECNSDEARIFCAHSAPEGAVTLHENCNQFYKCSNGKAVPFFCPSVLLYNPITKECDWPQNVVCGSRPIVEESEGDCSPVEPEVEKPSLEANCDPAEAPRICAADGSSGVLVAHENCNQFYMCNHGVPVTLNCYGNLMYNPFIGKCDWSEDVECGDRHIIDIDNGGENEGGNGDNDSTETCNCKPGEAPGICAAPNSDGIFVAHEECNQFYKCNHGVPVAMKCPFGLLYNPYIENCDWPHKVNCADRPIIGSSSEESEEENEGTCNCNPGEAPSICAAPNSNGILIMHENCNQYYKCNHGAPVTMNCPFGLMYNAYIERCDWAYKVKCGDRPVVDIDNGGNGSDGSDKSEEGNVGTCNCKPGEAPGICAAPNSDGIFVAHEECNQFYKCNHGVPVAMKCPFGLLYNPYIENCDWPHKVNCADRPIIGSSSEESEEENEGTCNCNPGEAPSICAAPNSNGILIMHENCNQYYKCNHGAPVTMNCPFGLMYNAYIERCDWAYKVKCGDRPVVDIDNGGNGSDGSDKSEEGNVGTCNCKPGEAPGICAAPNSDGIFVAHEECNQFYKCNHGVPVAMKCPFGLLYNPYIENCDWPHKVNCADRPIISSSSEESEEENEGTCNCNPGEAPSICAAPNSNGILIMHENCNQYYKCNHGAPVTMNCPFGLMYNAYIERCDWAYKVKCGNRPVVDIDNGGNGSDGSDKSEEGNVDTCNCKPGEAPGICAAPNSDGIFVAHEECNQFYKCNHGVPVAMKCPFGLLYNPYIENCDWPHKVNCADRPIIGSSSEESEEENEGTCNCNPGEAPSICAAPNSNGILIMHENCNQYYKCNHGAPVTMNCPFGLMYNAYTESCDWAYKVKCGDRPVVEIDKSGDDKDESSDESKEGNESSEEVSESSEDGIGGSCNCNPGAAPGICAAPGSSGILIAHEKCNLFYKCAHGAPVAMNCNAGLMYNPYTERCDWPHNVNCGDRPTVEIDNGGETEEDGNDGNCDPSEAPAICATGNSEGVLIAHEECNKFYKCSFGTPVAHACPKTLFYNPSIERCDWADNVECNDRIVIEDKNDSGNEDNNASGENNGNSADNCDPSQAPAICAASGSSGILVAHENCNKFYVCTDGSPVALSCPSNLLYNSKIGECDWPANVNCGNRVIPNVPENQGGECLCNSKQAPGVCAESNSDGKMIAHESCNQFYVCLNGKPIARSCPRSLLYDPHTMQCDWPASINCEERDVSLSFNKHVEARRGTF